MPPDPTNHLKLNRFSRRTPMITLSVCAMSQDQRPVKKIRLRYHCAKKESGFCNNIAAEGHYIVYPLLLQSIWTTTTTAHSNFNGVDKGFLESFYFCSRMAGTRKHGINNKKPRISPGWSLTGTQLKSYETRPLSFNISM